MNKLSTFLKNNYIVILLGILQTLILIIITVFYGFGSLYSKPGE